MKEIVPGLWDIDEIGHMVHAYAWQWEEGISLIDTGTPGNAEKILAALAQQGFKPHDVKRLIVTHADVDHVGSLRALKQATGAPIACHAVEKDLLEHPERRQPSKTLVGYAIRPLFSLFRRLPPFRVAPITPDELYLDGDRLPEGFTVIHTPGHTPGHISLLHPQRRLLIAGDALNTRNGTLSAPPPLFTPDPDNAHRSIAKLGKKYASAYDVMVFGHGDPVQENTQTRMQELIDHLPDAEA